MRRERESFEVKSEKWLEFVNMAWIEAEKSGKSRVASFLCEVDCRHPSGLMSGDKNVENDGISKKQISIRLVMLD